MKHVAASRKWTIFDPQKMTIFFHFQMKALAFCLPLTKISDFFKICKKSKIEKLMPIYCRILQNLGKEYVLEMTNNDLAWKLLTYGLPPELSCRLLSFVKNQMSLEPNIRRV